MGVDQWGPGAGGPPPAPAPGRFQVRLTMAPDVVERSGKVSGALTNLQSIEGSQSAGWISMDFALAVPFFGAVSLSTPSFMVALILAGSTLRGRVTDREKAP